MFLQLHSKQTNNILLDLTMGVVDSIWVLIVSAIPGLNDPKCISFPCLFSIHCLSSRSCLGAHQPAVKGSAWPKF